MPELVSRTLRIRRGWLERLRGFDHHYETKITDGERVKNGRGATREASERSALSKWDAQFGHATEVTGELPLPAPSIALNAGKSTSLGITREVIDALRADDGRLLRLLIKRFAKRRARTKKAG